MTLAVVVLVVTALIRWIGQISAIGRVSHTIDRVERATREAFTLSGKHPVFDCRVQIISPQGMPIKARDVGYVQHVDAGQLQALAEAHALTIAITARPGAYVSPNRPLMLIEGVVPAEAVDDLIAAFVIGDRRTFYSDPRFGLVVLGEIASKALSPGINDPGTAIDVVGTLVRVLIDRPATDPNWQPRHDRISVPSLDPTDLINDAFRPIARDGAATIEVVLRLLVGLKTLAFSSPDLKAPALVMARDVAARARQALTAQSDRDALDAAMDFADTPADA